MDGRNARLRLVERVVEDACAGTPLSDPDEIERLLEVPSLSVESALLRSAARELSERASQGKAEVHAQVALNVGPCPRNCLFCAFAHSNRVFAENQEAELDYVIASCRQLEHDGANAVFLMATGAYPMERFMERGAAVREALQPQTVLVANVGDFDPDAAASLRANLLWAEVGGNPRDTTERTEEGRGMSVQQCRQVLAEAEWEVLDGPSRFYRPVEPCPG